MFFDNWKFFLCPLRSWGSSSSLNVVFLCLSQKHFLKANFIPIEWLFSDVWQSWRCIIHRSLFFTPGWQKKIHGVKKIWRKKICRNIWFSRYSLGIIEAMFVLNFFWIWICCVFCRYLIAREIITHLKTNFFYTLLCKKRPK